jgi:predicted HTH domain antitoxin
MDITVSIPDKFVPPPTPGIDLSREVLEAYAIESYRQEKMSLGQVAEMLELSISETHAFLKDHNIRLNYDLQDLERDSRTIERFLKK